ncbi:MAG: hypothetical protein EZS28_029009 [Streblomastix strix]|uniref:Uncharacterized protein n=1 Tax=Streblomastix strix TaxID=222440 RepID=A0A5J4V0A6_9EUKA|nr:MAG: hypothetical protein EZS28_029009 [Streblomastix strix]
MKQHPIVIITASTTNPIKSPIHQANFDFYGGSANSSSSVSNTTSTSSNTVRPSIPSDPVKNLRSFDINAPYYFYLQFRNCLSFIANVANYSSNQSTMLIVFVVSSNGGQIISFNSFFNQFLLVIFLLKQMIDFKMEKGD